MLSHNALTSHSYARGNFGVTCGLNGVMKLRIFSLRKILIGANFVTFQEDKLDINLTN